MYPSLYEGFGLPVLEAMKSGVPVITADNSSLPEVGGNAVLYVSGFDEDETSEAISKLLNDESLIKALKSKEAKQVKLFSWDNAVNTIMKELK